MAEQTRKLLGVTGPAGRTLVISELPDSGRFVIDDPAGAGRLGDLNGDLMPFVLGIDDAPFIVFAGAVPGPGANRVEITSPGFSGIHQTCWVRNQVWMSVPEPFVAGMGITVPPSPADM
jgi:hypothetical protein